MRDVEVKPFPAVWPEFDRSIVPPDQEKESESVCVTPASGCSARNLLSD